MKVYFTIFLIASFAKISTAQSISVRLTAALDSFENNYPQEKMFVHTDRSTYTTEETIWFKAYCTLDGLPSDISKIIYVELVNEKNAVVEKRMLHATIGTAYSDIFINKDFPSGTYSLNAYTLWMLNFPEYIFRKQIFIYNTDFKNTSVAQKADFTVQFLPEGGNLVQGLKSNVAFKAITLNGLPISISGDILDSKNNKLAGIQSQHDGMGSFDLTPVNNESYRAVFFTPDGKEKSVPIPMAKPEGIVLHINNEGAANIFFKLQRSEQNSHTYNKIILVGRMNNTIVYSADLNFDEGKAAGAINKKKFPTGILQLTAFSEAGIPLAERLVFISNYQLPDITIQTDSFSTDKRKKNQFEINLSDFKNLSASLSITNYNADSALYNENLLTSLLLTSDIKGYVHNPAYYFKDKNAETAKHLDLLLMTQGWRRLNWQQLLSHQFPAVKYFIESDISIKGRITKLNGKNSIPASRIDFITKTEDSVTILSTVTINNNDQFVLSGLNFKKKASIFYQGNNTKKENSLVKVSFSPSFFDSLKYSTNYFAIPGISNLSELHFTAFYQKTISDKVEFEKRNVKILSEVIIKTKKLSPVDSLNQLYASDVFQNSDQTISFIEREPYSIWQFLQSQISGINVGRNEFGEPTVVLRDFGQTGSMFSTDPTTNIDFYLNEIKVSKNMIESIDPADFVLAKIWKGASASSIGSDQAAIVFYTDKTKANSAWMTKGFDVLKKEGYSVSREFYSPDYDRLKPEIDFSDHRATLYWNPNLKPDKNGIATIKFFNDDETKKFKVVIQGIDLDGKIISLQKILY